MSNHRFCQAPGCPRAIPDAKRFDARYCSSRCRWREQKRRQLNRRSLSP